MLDRLRALLSSWIDIGDTFAPLDLDAHALDAALRNAFALSERWLAMPHVELKSLLRDIVEQITVAAERIEIRLSRAKIAVALEAGGGSQRPDIDPSPCRSRRSCNAAAKGSASSSRMVPRPKSTRASSN